MPKLDYRIPSRRERELFNQVRNLQERLDALSKDPSAELEIRHLEGVVAERDSAIASLESELESERARAARLRGELDGARAKRKELEALARQLKCDVGNERARTKSAQSNYERMAESHARLHGENAALKERVGELEFELDAICVRAIFGRVRHRLWSESGYGSNQHSQHNERDAKESFPVLKCEHALILFSHHGLRRNR